MVEKNKKRAELGEVWATSKWDVFVEHIMLLIILGASGVLVAKVIMIMEAMGI